MLYKPTDLQTATALILRSVFLLFPSIISYHRHQLCFALLAASDLGNSNSKLQPGFSPCPSPSPTITPPGALGSLPTLLLAPSLRVLPSCKGAPTKPTGAGLGGLGTLHKTLLACSAAFRHHQDAHGQHPHHCYRWYYYFHAVIEAVVSVCTSTIYISSMLEHQLFSIY